MEPEKKMDSTAKKEQTKETVDDSETMRAHSQRLALAGESQTKAGNFEKALRFFHAALPILDENSKEDAELLSAVYCQMGHCYFFLKDYDKALDYHSKDWRLAVTDEHRAKVYCNLGVCYKMSGDFERAAEYARRHFEIADRCNDRVSCLRALYNLGCTFQDWAKVISDADGSADDEEQQDSKSTDSLSLPSANGSAEAPSPSSQSPDEDNAYDIEIDVQTCYEQAISYFELDLALACEIGPSTLKHQGHILGHLGYILMVLCRFDEAVIHHEQRFRIAEQLGDLHSQRRASSNLGNCYVLLGDIKQGLVHFQRALELSTQLKDLALQAQCYYSIGNAFSLLLVPEKAIEYHSKHLEITKQLQDKLGECRAYLSLSNDHKSSGNRLEASRFQKLHSKLSRELQSAPADKAEMTISQLSVEDIRNLVTPKRQPSANSKDLASNTAVQTNNMACSPFTAEDLSALNSTSFDNKPASSLTFEMPSPSLNASTATVSSTFVGASNVTAEGSDDLVSMRSTPRMDDAVSSTPRLMGSNRSSMAKMQLVDMSPSQPAASSIEKQNSKETIPAESGQWASTENVTTAGADADDEFKLAGVLGSLDEHSVQPGDQPDAALMTADLANVGHNDEFFEQLFRLQAQRIEDQRVSVNGIPRRYSTKTTDLDDDDLFALLVRLQSNRLNDQRASIEIEPRTPPMNRQASVGTQEQFRSPTLPDDDFYGFLMNLQSKRMDEQRAPLKAHNCPPVGASVLVADSGEPSFEAKRSRKKKFGLNRLKRSFYGHFHPVPRHAKTSSSATTSSVVAPSATAPSAASSKGATTGRSGPSSSRDENKR